MDVKLQIQGTPNPNALKFVLNVPVRTEGKAIYKTIDQCGDNAIARALFEIENISEVYFFDNYITVTQNGRGDWDQLEEKIQTIILELISAHDPDFQIAEPEKPQHTTPDHPDVAKINSILDQTIRPALQMDGGDLQIVGYEGNTLKINYHGACGSCPSATMGTLKAIENILRDEFKPDLVVELAE